MRPTSMPLYSRLKRQLHDRLSQALRDGQARPGDFFTTEKDVCRDFHVSAITAKRALDDMESEGTLVRQRGRGTFIAEPRLTLSLHDLHRLERVGSDQGLALASQVVRVESELPETLVAEALGVRGRDRVLAFERVISLNGQPYLVETSYVAAKRHPGLEEAARKASSLWAALEEHFNAVAGPRSVHLEPALLHKQEAQYLQSQPRTAGLRFHITTPSQSGRPLMFSRLVLRGDRCRFNFNLG